MTKDPAWGRRGLARLLPAMALLLAVAAARPSAANDLDALRQRSQRGDAEAQYVLAVKLHAGDGVARDDVESRTLLLKAAAQGHLEAQRSLGFYYWRSYGGPQDKVEALKWILIAERGGNKDAPSVRAFMLKGMSTEQVQEARARAGAEPARSAATAPAPAAPRPAAAPFDPEKVRTAAENGSAEAQVALSKHYTNGEHRDDKAALRWARAAADQGDNAGQKQLGILYLIGRGVPQDQERAAEWLRKSAAQGDQESAGMLTMLPTLATLARELEAQTAGADIVRKAAEAGDAQAQYQLSRLYAEGAGVPRDKGLEVDWERKAAEQDHVQAMGSYGTRLVLTLDGVKGDFWKGYSYLYRAGALGHLPSQRVLGLLYQRGTGVKKDVVMSLIWLDMAAKAGDARATELREATLKQASPAQVAEAERRTVAWIKRPPKERMTPEGAP